MKIYNTSDIICLKGRTEHYEFEIQYFYETECFSIYINMAVNLLTTLFKGLDFISYELHKQEDLSEIWNLVPEMRFVAEFAADYVELCKKFEVNQ